MDAKHEKLDSHEKPPKLLMDVFKSWKARARSDETEQEIPNFLKQQPDYQISSSILQGVFEQFQATSDHNHDRSLASYETSQPPAVPAYRSLKLPGLIVVPSLLPPAIQKTLLSRLLHRDLSNPNHATNLHTHYNVTYPKESLSFFSEELDRSSFNPKDPEVHRSLTVRNALTKKLRWLTLGGQYDWSSKVYPAEPPPPFPADIAELIRSLFPDMEPQAGIVNIYSPGDTLSLHRDVSEEVDKGLVSISIGCDALFVIGLQDNQGNADTDPTFQYEVLRLKSGDAVYMSDVSRLAWHGVPSIVPGTCPSYLDNWPADEYSEWKGWMGNKRINLNVRQMFKVE